MTFAHDPAQDAPPPDLRLDDALFEIAAWVPFKAGEEIFSQDEAADLIYQLVSGEVALTTFAFGRHHRVGFLETPGDLFGLEPGPAHEMTAEALSDCMVLVASRRGLAFILGERDFADAIAPEFAPGDPTMEGRPN